MPAPTMHTSTWTFCSRGVNCGSAAVAVQTDWWSGMVGHSQQETNLQLRRLLASLLRFFPHGDEFFGGRRVDPDGRVELRLGGAKLYRDADALDDFAGVGADHVRADYALARPVDDQLHERTFLL